MNDQAIPTLRERKRELTRTLLLDTAWEVFATTGYLAATVDDIVAGAGCSRATFYLHFSSKAAIMVEALRQRWPRTEETAEQFDKALDQGMTRAEIKAWVSGGLRAVATTPGTLTAIHNAALNEPEVAEWLTTMEVKDAEAHRRFLARFEGEDRRRVRARLIVLSHLPISIFEMSERISDLTEADLIDYLSDVFTEFFINPLGLVAEAADRETEVSRS